MELKPEHHPMVRDNKLTLRMEDHNLKFKEEIELTITKEDIVSRLKGIITAVRSREDFDIVEIYPKNHEEEKL